MIKKKIALIMLGSYIATSTMPTFVLAATATDDVTVVKKDVVQEDIGFKEGVEVLAPTDEAPQNESIEDKLEETPRDNEEQEREDKEEEKEKEGEAEKQSMSNFTITYVDKSGKEIAKRETMEDVFETTPTEFTELASHVRDIQNYCIHGVKINGVYFEKAATVNFGIGEGFDDISIEWIYDTKEIAVSPEDFLEKFRVSSLVHESFFGDATFESTDYITPLFPDNMKFNLYLGDNAEYVYKSLKDGVAKVSLGFVGDTKNPDKYDFLEYVNGGKYTLGTLSYILENAPEGEAPKTFVSYEFSDSLIEKQFHSSNKEKIFVYQIDAETKSLSKAGELVLGDYEDTNIFEGEIENALNGEFVYSTVEIDLKTNKPIYGLEDEPNDENDENDDVEVDKRGFGLFELVYDDISEELRDNAYYSVNGTDGLDFYLMLESNNVLKIFERIGKTNNIDIKISDNVSGTAKYLSDKYSKNILQKVTISGSDLTTFENSNKLEFSKSGHIYAASNSSDDTIKYYGEVKAGDTLETKSSLTNTTFFVMDSKIELSADGKLPDTSGALPIAMMLSFGATAAGATILKKKK